MKSLKHNSQRKSKPKNSTQKTFKKLKKCSMKTSKLHHTITHPYKLPKKFHNLKPSERKRAKKECVILSTLAKARKLITQEPTFNQRNLTKKQLFHFKENAHSNPTLDHPNEKLKYCGINVQLTQGMHPIISL
jgi:hypothetical protein